MPVYIIDVDLSDMPSVSFHDQFYREADTIEKAIKDIDGVTGVREIGQSYKEFLSKQEAKAAS